MKINRRPLDFRILLKQWLLIAAGVAIASFLNDGIRFESISSLILAVLFISLFNVFLKPILVLFGLPFIMMTLGLGILLINAVIFALAGYLVPGFHVLGFGAAFWGAFVVSLTTMLVNILLSKPKITVQRTHTRAPRVAGGAKEYRGKLDDDVIDV
ncbi:MAG: phage holin family protein [Verrucomicrobia bacterium]|nr:phage holin family protein [Verrucomicrobiota bacterium]MDA1067531.1 phage holin family protein [Verrucomicrobiota bacterium]